MTEKEEQIYLQGNQQAWLHIVQEALKHLCPTTQKEITKIMYINAVKERTETILGLRRVCEDFGDNDWEDELYLTDIIDKHLGKYLYAREYGIEGDYESGDLKQQMLNVYEEFEIDIHAIPGRLQSSFNNVIKEVIKLRVKAGG